MHYKNRHTLARWSNSISALKRMCLFLFLAVPLVFRTGPVFAAEAEIYQGEPAVYDIPVRHTVREILAEGNYIITIPASLQPPIHPLHCGYTWKHTRSERSAELVSRSKA